MSQKKPSTTTGSAEVRLISEVIIECVLRGDITGKIVEGSMAETKKLAEQVRATGKKPRLLIDMHDLTHQDSDARSRSKEMISFGMEKIAIVGAGRMLKTVGQYIVRIAGLRRYTKFFRTRTGAMHWLEAKAIKIPSQKPLLMTLCALLVMAIAAAALTGWVRSNEILVATIPGLPVMNPVTAVCLVLLALAILLLGRKQTRASRLIIYVIASLTAIFGLLVGLRHFFGIDIPVDQLLFVHKLDEFGQHGGRASSGASPLFISASGLLVLATVGLKSAWQRHVFQLAALVSVSFIAVIIVGYVFGMVELYDIVHITLPLNTSIAFLVVTISIVGAVYKKGMFPRTSWVARNYGRGLLVTGGILLLTGLLWQQTNMNIARSLDAQAQQTFDDADVAIQTRVNAYVDALHGYKAFFESSSEVNEDEFGRYFTHSELQKNYPGFSSISFVRAVKSSDGSEQYPLAYIEPSNTSTVTKGTNIGLLPERRALFEAARDSGEPHTSEPVSLTNLNGQGSEDGFIISIPIYKDGGEPTNTRERRENIYGFVNAVFRNKVLFNEIFEPLRSSEAGFRVYDVDKNEKNMYQTSASLDFSSPRVTRTITAPGEQWQLDMQTVENFGASNVTSSIPGIMLGSGIVVALLSGFLVVSLSRRREEALTLAASMTEDLNNEREQAETSRKKDDAILASIGDAVFAIGKNERITLFNPAAVKLTGFSEQEALGNHYSDILAFVGSDNKPNFSFIHRALGGHITSMKNDMRLIRKDGSIIEVADSAAPIYDFSGKLQGVIVVFRDVTSERALDQAKSEFVSLASHQLRTPLSAINWYSEMLLNQDAGKLNKDQHEYMKEIYEGNQRMIELVDSLLNVSRLEVGKLRNEPQDVSLVELADSLQKELQTSIEAKKLTLTRNIAPKLPTVSADPKLLRMVMQNLLSNAVKYTPDKGRVVLDIHQATEKELHHAGLRSGQYFFLSVSDNGYGIPKEQQGKIFEKLFRADNVRKMDVEGTGLGLYIVQEVARKLGGTIWFESTESVGTTFYVIIPLKTKPS